MISAASLMVTVGANTAGAEKGLNNVSGLLGKALPAAAIVGVLAVAGIGLASIKMAGDFQAGMTSLVTGAGESSKNIGLVSAGMLKMAVDTGTSTTQLTAGMFMIESAGYHGADGLKVLQAAAEGAKVGNADLGVTSDALTTILKDYPNVTNGAAGAMNTLTATVASGKTHLVDLAGAMAQILPTSSAAGVGLNDVMGAMATMTGEGVPAANAATYLRQTILALDAPSKGTVKALKDVGLSSTAVADEMQKSLPDALKMITDAVGKKFPVGSAAYVAAMKNIAGGSKQMQGILDLTGNHMDDFTTNVKGVADQVKKGGQTIVGWSDVQGDFNFKIDKAKEVVQTFMIRLGTGLLPVAGQVVDLFSTYFVPAIMAVVGAVLSVVTAVGNFISWLQQGGVAADAMKIVLGALAGAMVGLAVKGVVGVVQSMIAGWPAWSTQIGLQIDAAITALAAVAPYLLIGAAIGVVIGVIILAVTHWKQIAAFLETTWKNVVSGVQIGLAALGGFFRTAFSTITTDIQKFITGAEKIWDKWKTPILVAAGILATVFGPALIQAGITAVTSGAQIAGSFIANLVATGTASVVQGAKVVASFAASMVTSAAQAVTSGAQIAATFIVSMVQTGAKAVISAGQIVATFIPAIIAQGIAMATAAAGGIASAITGLIAYAVAGWAAAAATLAATWPILAIIVAVAALIAVVILIVTHWKQVVGVLGVVKNALGAALGWIGHFVGGALGWFGNLFGGIFGGLGKIAGFIGGAFSSAIQGITGVFSSVFGGLWGIVKAPINMIIGGINGLINGLDSIHFDIPSWVPGVGGKGFGISIPDIPMLAAGGTIAQAGYAVVGDAGPELLHLPTGAQVAPLTHPSPITGLPSGMQQTHGAASGTAGGQTVQLNVYLDAVKFAQIMTKLQPQVIRNGTGSRSF